jgi:beta-lactam-binding protein with PASTA domain
MPLRERLERTLRLAALAFVLAAAAFLSAVTTIRVAIRGRVVTMPDVVGRPLGEAQQIMDAGGLQLRVADRTYNTLPPNTVVRQSPAPG